MTSHTGLRIVGITGMIAAGKSHVARWMESIGGLRLDADRIAREQLDAPEVIDALVARFGNSIRGGGGTIDRAALAAKVFKPAVNPANGNPADCDPRRDLKVLESIVHPRVRRVMTDAIAAESRTGNRAVILDVPLLVESGWHRCCDEVVAVVCDAAVQIDRVERRGWTADELDRRQQHQMPIARKKAAATVIVDTSDGDEGYSRILAAHFAALGFDFGPSPPIGPKDHCGGGAMTDNE